MKAWLVGVVAIGAIGTSSCAGHHGHKHHPMHGQRQDPMPGRGMGGHLPYDVQAEVMLGGEVVEIQRVPSLGRGQRVQFLLRTQDGEIEVRLGPDRFVDAQPLQLRKGDRIEVVGARAPVEDGTVILAREARRGGEVLTLRHPDGQPVWMGQGGPEGMPPRGPGAGPGGPRGH